ncbi:hypothetical protein GF337_17300 [candidate division KSB1 bacterium]|nr:hypothetical protein [candidate division KSB1 bacterium]
MPRRLGGRRIPRKKPPRKNKIINTKINEKLREFALTGFMWFLAFANLIIVISFLFQSLKASQQDENRVTPKPGIAEQQPVERPKEGMIRVEVLNGCGENKVAARLRNYLVDRNIDVVDFKNYDRFDIPQTLAIDRKYMDARHAEKIADLVGVDDENVFPQISPQRKLDVSIIIGQDFMDLKAFKTIFNQQ